MKYKQFKAWLLEGIFDDLGAIGRRGAEIEAERVKNMGMSPRQYQAKPLSINKTVDKEIKGVVDRPSAYRPTAPQPAPAKKQGLSPLPAAYTSSNHSFNTLAYSFDNANENQADRFEFVIEPAGAPIGKFGIDDETFEVYYDKEKGDTYVSSDIGPLQVFTGIPVSPKQIEKFFRDQNS